VSAPANGTAVVVSLDGTPVHGDIWRLTVNTTDYDFEVGSGAVTLEEIAAALAGQLDGVTDTDVALRATAAGATIVIVDTDTNGSGTTVAFKLLLQSGPAFAGSATAAPSEVVAVTLAGAPQDGETWSVDFDSITSDIPVVTGGVDTLEEIVAALAADFNGQTSEYRAIADGATLLIVKATGAFTAAVTTDVVGPDVSSSVDATAGTVILSLAGTPVAGSVWTVTISGQPAVDVTVGQSYYDWPVAGEPDIVVLHPDFGLVVGTRPDWGPYGC